MSSILEVIQDGPSFDLSGGHICLDFANTLDERTSNHPREGLPRYRDLVLWGMQERILTTEQAEQLLGVAAQHEQEAAAVLERAKEVREVMFRIFSAIASAAVPPEADLARLNQELARTMEHACIVQDGRGFAWDWCADTVMLDHVLWPLVRAAADLLVSDELRMVRLCAAEDCSWLFLDTSKNQTRRWCNMKSCGNRAKARRYSARKRGK